ncbi:MAG TPA: hypothetical protein DCE41_32980 [Cytophagales bacterium]|nr:hypothetical protein [Cytophagales bacterium]HAA21820.1 hypothetical protein [Cytophagales bacterium]HAP62950.1 hypothetical protein [Cytophagales bacterium]
MKNTLLLLLVFIGMPAFAQESFDGKVYETFYGTRIIHGQSVEMEKEGTLKFIIGHRFGLLKDGVYGLFGLDNSFIRFGLDYGVSPWLTVGVGRSSEDKTYDGYVKARLLQQGDKSPISLVAFSSISARTLRLPETSFDYRFAYRLAFTQQLMIARKFSDGFSLQLMPTYVHKNLVDSRVLANDIIALGIAPRVKVSSNVAINAEFYQPLVGALPFGNQPSLALGVDIYTKGHLFQVHVSNSRGLIARNYVTETTGSILDGDFHLGFNITRNFQVRGRKY